MRDGGSCATGSNEARPVGRRRRRGQLKTFGLQMATVTLSVARDGAVGARAAQTRLVCCSELITAAVARAASASTK
jgi:hypothetical protein